MARQPVLSAEDKKWRARQDADTLRQAEELRSSKVRLNAAKAHLKKELTSINKAIKKK